MPTASPAPLLGRYLSFAEREEIAILRARGASGRAIARRLRRAPSTISREVRRNQIATGRGTKQVEAFNLADGTRTQSEIAEQVKMDQGQLSRTVSRWIEAGIMFRLGDGRDAKLLHIYPIPAALPEE